MKNGDDAEAWFAVMLEAAKEGAWEFVAREGVVTISKKQSEDGTVTSFRGQGILPFEPELVASLLMDPDKQVSYNPQLRSATVVQQKSAHERVWHKVFRAKKCMLDIHRDILFLEHCKRVDDSIVIAAKSSAVEQTLVPSPDKCVRAELIIGGWVLEPWMGPKGKKECSATYLAQVDLKNLPSESNCVLLALSSRCNLSPLQSLFWNWREKNSRM